MNADFDATTQILDALKERAKELNCIYQVEELLQDRSLELPESLQQIISILPAGWRFPEACQARIIHGDNIYQSVNFQEATLALEVPLRIQDTVVGSLEVSYREEVPEQDDGPFLKEERRLIKAIGERVGQAILHRRLEPIFESGRDPTAGFGDDPRGSWQSVLDMLRITDERLFKKITRQMLNYLCYMGLEEARQLLEQLAMSRTGEITDGEHDGVNRPSQRQATSIDRGLSQQVMSIASQNVGDDVIFSQMRKWIEENKISALLDVLEDLSTNLSDIIEAINKYRESGAEESGISESTQRAVNVSLIRRFFSRRLEFINLAKRHVTLQDFHRLTQNLIYPLKSHGQLGGKSAGLFVAFQVVQNSTEKHPELKAIRIPKTWFITSDGILDFIHHNHLEELLEFKYRDIGRIRAEYPNLIQLFKNSTFSQAIVNGLSMALDDFGDRPLIVRSSSLLEDSIGAAFSGKHKSLFIANQGTKRERMEALLDAIAEVYASMFGPDPIQYRAERGLLDFPEAMGILLQEVVGTQVDNLVFPAFAGVAFSRNEFRWSPRIQQEDGLARIVPGLGTRAVDRLSDDYPVLIAPGQPNLRVNSTVDDVVRYAPRYMDVINLTTNSIETVTVESVLSQIQTRYPRFRQIFSLVRDNLLVLPHGLIDLDEEHAIPTFEGLFAKTPFVAALRTLMQELEKHYAMPVDIEFAADKDALYLLQCRPQSASLEDIEVSIPSDIPKDSIVFTADRYITNGAVPNITHVVYVDPEAYSQLGDKKQLRDVASIVGRLNDILPKRQFILMGPGRWGSRGDITLGVPVTYADINNTGALIEMAFQKGSYLPDLSFGTHFFQDLVEAEIKYLPLYPDDGHNIFNRAFLEQTPNQLTTFLPDTAAFKEVVRVIDVKSVQSKHQLRILMDAELNKAVAYLSEISPEVAPSRKRLRRGTNQLLDNDEFWTWRQKMAERIAASMEQGKMGVQAIYVFGSTKNATAGPCSDIDLLIHFNGSQQEREGLLNWLDGWSRALAETNFLRTGCKEETLLDIHIVTDEDIANKTSFACKIDAVSDAARPLTMGNRPLKG